MPGLRIVGGRHRGRRLATPAGRSLRPTSERVREALFNVLQHSDWGADGGDPLADAVILDAFCGTGALALEALSRGAEKAWLLDSDPAVLALARRNVAALGEEDRAVVVKADATRPPPAHRAAGLGFLDPPYGLDLAGTTLTALRRRGWLSAGCLCVVELARREAFAAPGWCALLDERCYGETRLIFLRGAEDAW